MGLRLIAAGLVLFSCWRLSDLARRPFQLRVRTLEQWGQLLLRLVPLIEWRRVPLGEALEEAAVGQHLLRPAMRQLAADLQDRDLTFDSAWSALLNRLPGLWTEDRNVLLDLGRVLGTSEAHYQHDHLEAAHRELERLVSEARLRQGKDGRLFSVLVNALGLTVVILML